MMAGSSRTLLGASGESLAARWYEETGYEVLARNWRCRQGELDLICRRGSLLVVCEVKTRSSARFGSPAEAVTAGKQRRIRRLAALWLAGQGEGFDLVRFDVAGVVGSEVSVIEQAF